MKALIVEDDPVIRDTLKELLHYWGLHRLVVAAGCRTQPIEGQQFAQTNPR